MKRPGADDSWRVEEGARGWVCASGLPVVRPLPLCPSCLGAGQGHSPGEVRASLDRCGVVFDLSVCCKAQGWLWELGATGWWGLDVCACCLGGISPAFQSGLD